METNDEFGLPPKSNDLDELAQVKAELAELRARKELATLKAELALEKELAELPAPDNQGFPKKYVKIEVFKSQNPEDPEFATPSIGGYVVNIRRGEKVVVHECIMKVLADAVETKLIPELNGGYTLRDAPRFPFSVHGPATEEEYLAFQAKMKAQSTPVAAPA